MAHKCYFYDREETMVSAAQITEKDEWKEKAANYLKSLLMKRGVKYEALVRMLAEIGVEETYVSVSNKINRGTFSFIFFWQCMEALGVREVRFD